MGLFFNVMIILCLLFFAVAISMKSQRHVAFYQFRPTRNLVQFEDIAVVTTSQQCNDLARVLVVEGFSIRAVAVAMQFCLKLTAPHKSGSGGSSTAVFVDLNDTSSCHIMDTFKSYRVPYIGGNSTQHNVSQCIYEQLYGTRFNSVALPGDIVTLSQFLQGMKLGEVERLLYFLKDYKYDTYVVSHSIAKANRLYSPWLLVSGELDWMFDEYEAHRPLDEGELYKLRNEAIEALLFVLKYNRTKMNKNDVWSNEDSKLMLTVYTFTLIPSCRESSFETKIRTQAGTFWNRTSDQGWRKSEGQIFGEYMLCMPDPYSEAVSEAEQQTKHREDDGEITSRVLSIHEILAKVYRFVKMKSEEENGELPPEFPVTHTVKSEGNIYTLKDEDKSEHPGPWQSNMFVIVNRTDKKAIAYVGTLGKFFGSKIKSAYDTFFLNNILAEVKDKNNNIDPFVRLLPAILYTQNEISLAIATSGGSTKHSLSLPRTVSMLVLKKSFNLSISDSAGHPIAFPSTENFNVTLKDRVPYVERLHRMYKVNDTKLTLPDEVVAVEAVGDSLSAMHADHLDEIYHMPAGI